MVKVKGSKHFGKKAQVAIELAVFGSVFLFVIGLIVRQALSFSLQQNQQLRAMRIAMVMSSKESGGFGSTGGGSDGNSSRNSASVLLLEDRLVVETGKYGSFNRTPTMVQGSATHSRNLLMPFDWGEEYNLPRFDVFVNGIHFSFTLASFKTVYPNDGPRTPYNWDPHCWDIYDWATDSDNPEGCRKYFSKVPNHPVFRESSRKSWEDKWCEGSSPACDDSFDLDRNGFRVAPDSPDVPDSLRDTFSWQWKTVPAMWGQIMINDDDPSKNRNTSLDVDGDLHTEGIMGVARKIHGAFRHWTVNGCSEHISSSDSADTIVQSDCWVYHRAAGYRYLRVVDFQEGDMNFTEGSNYAGPTPGFQPDLQLFTRVKDGTYLLIEEGNLYSTGGQFIRTASKKEHIDIIMRVLQLSNNTGRFCPGGFPSAMVDGEPNPVEVCCGGLSCSNGAATCFDQASITKTCMDTNNLKIYVRSRVADRFGHKWVTKLDEDPYINYQTPSIP